MAGYEMHHNCLNSIILAQLCQKTGQGFTMRGLRAISLHQHLYECVWTRFGRFISESHF